MTDAPARTALARTLRYDGSWDKARAVEVPVEVPINLVYGGMPHVVLMATPEHLDDLALGFTLTEGIAANRADIRSVATQPVEGGIRVEIDLAPEAMKRFLARRRNMAGRTSCGLCGVETLDQLTLREARLSGEPIASPAIAKALQALSALQPLHGRTHAVHAAAWFSRAGDALLAREDVGRHNALDKMIGGCLVAGLAPEAGFAVITSRCSFEMVEKAAMFGASTLVAISAPTSLAIERADVLGITLIAVARADTAMAFTDPSSQPNRALIP